MYVIPTYKNIMIGVENSEEGQIVDYDQMIRIIYLPQFNAPNILCLPSFSKNMLLFFMGGIKVCMQLYTYVWVYGKLEYRIVCLKKIF